MSRANIWTAAIILFVMSTVSLIVSCEPSAKEQVMKTYVARTNPANYNAEAQFALTTPGLEGCVYTRLNSTYTTSTPILHIIRCPNSTTTSEWSIGKSGNQSVTTESK